MFFAPVGQLGYLVIFSLVCVSVPASSQGSIASIARQMNQDWIRTHVESLQDQIHEADATESVSNAQDCAAPTASQSEQSLPGFPLASGPDAALLSRSESAVTFGTSQTNASACQESSQDTATEQIR
jgi:hypothetical protein